MQQNFLFFLLVLSFGRGELCDYLSAIEKEVFEEQNYARTRPKEYAKYLENMIQYFDGNLYKVPGKITLITKEGAAAVEEAIDALKAQQPLQPMKVSPGMSKSCEDHVKDQGPTGQIGHTGTDGSSPFDRMNRYGKWGSFAGENIAYSGTTSGRDIIIQLLVDDGVKSRGHRKSILSENFGVTGVGCGSHSKYGGMCVIVYAGSYQNNDQSTNDDKCIEVVESSSESSTNFVSTSYSTTESKEETLVGENDAHSRYYGNMNFLFSVAFTFIGRIIFYH